MRYLRRFRNVRSIEVVCQAHLLKLIVFVFPLLSCAVLFAKLILSNSDYLTSQEISCTRFLFVSSLSLSPTPSNTQLALSSSPQSLARSPPPLPIVSSHNISNSTINDRNQPPLGMAGARFLSCTRRTKRSTRLYDLPMSRNHTPISSLTPGRGQH